MPVLRNLLVTVLCALLALGQSPLRSRAACKADAARTVATAAAPSCCQPRACCCGGDVRGACGMQDCGSGRERRAPTPAPQPKPVQIDLARGGEPRPVRMPTPNATADARAAVAPRSSRALGFRALPQRLRQEALSVWRC